MQNQRFTFEKIVLEEGFEKFCENGIQNRDRVEESREFTFSKKAPISQRSSIIKQYKIT